MRAPLGLASALLSLALAPVAAAEPGAAEALLASQPPEVRRALKERGTAVLLPPEQDGLRPVVGLALFERPVARVLELLVQTTRQGEYRSGVKVERVMTEGDVLLDEHRIRWFLATYRYRIRTRLDLPRRRIEWELDPTFDNDLEWVQGFWQLHPLDESRTLGLTGTRVNIGSGLPRFFQNYATRKNLPEVLEHTKRWVDSDGEARP